MRAKVNTIKITMEYDACVYTYEGMVQSVCDGYFPKQSVAIQIRIQFHELIRGGK